MSDQPRVPFNKLEAGKKYFSRRTSADYMIFLITSEEEVSFLNARKGKGLFIKYLNVSSTRVGGMYILAGKKTIIYPREYNAGFPNAYVFKRKHYSMIFDLLFK